MEDVHLGSTRRNLYQRRVIQMTGLRWYSAGPRTPPPPHSLNSGLSEATLLVSLIIFLTQLTYRISNQPPSLCPLPRLCLPRSARPSMRTDPCASHVRCEFMKLKVYSGIVGTTPYSKFESCFLHIHHQGNRVLSHSLHKRLN